MTFKKEINITVSEKTIFDFCNKFFNKEIDVKRHDIKTIYSIYVFHIISKNIDIKEYSKLKLLSENAYVYIITDLCKNNFIQNDDGIVEIKNFNYDLRHNLTSEEKINYDYDIVESYRKNHYEDFNDI